MGRFCCNFSQRVDRDVTQSASINIFEHAGRRAFSRWPDLAKDPKCQKLLLCLRLWPGRDECQFLREPFAKRVCKFRIFAAVRRFQLFDEERNCVCAQLSEWLEFLEQFRIGQIYPRPRLIPILNQAKERPNSDATLCIAGSSSQTKCSPGALRTMAAQTNRQLLLLRRAR